MMVVFMLPFQGADLVFLLDPWRCPWVDGILPFQGDMPGRCKWNDGILPFQGDIVVRFS